MTPQEFVDKWSKIQLKETAASQSHFNDICRLIDHPTPVDYDPSGKNFSFETQTVKPGGQKGFADVYFRDHFIWEYKGPHKDLDRAYRQLQLYREALDNPPLLITSDLHTIEIHTNFTNYPTKTHMVTFENILDGKGFDLLHNAFFDPTKLRPDKTQEQITKATADTFIRVADGMKQHRQLMGETYSAEELAHFLVRLLFCLFAEDMGLLPEGVFTEIVRTQGGNYAELQPVLKKLFTAMRDGGTFGWYSIRHFNGTLFDDDFVPIIPFDLGSVMLKAAEQDWAQVDPSIFGTMFERVIDESKRAQLGAHYTSEQDIMLIVEPVLMQPLKRRWDEVRRNASVLLGRNEKEKAHEVLSGFADEIAAMRVLDPACGSGNFLYVALRELMDLQKEAIAFAARKDLPPIPLTVSPEQLYGIEINPYAHELAQITAWIGYLQWLKENGFEVTADPILKPLKNIKRMDAILAHDENGKPAETKWPAAEAIIGNPPFLGNKRMRIELGDSYIDEIHRVFKKRLPNKSDLVCYWFEKARDSISSGNTKRAALIATNSIRGSNNREVLDRIKQDGDIFYAYSDRPWILDGAAVRVSIVGFDDGSQIIKTLNGDKVQHINSDLTHAIDLTSAKVLGENAGVAFMGDTKVGPFDIDWPTAKKMLEHTGNPNNKPNSDVVVPWANGLDITRRARNMWIIDFGVDTSEKEASQYALPFDYISEHVKPFRKTARSGNRTGVPWWIHQRPRPAMRKALESLEKYIVTPRVAKHRLFVFLTKPTLPDSRLYVIAREDDYFLGVLHSSSHEIWSLATSSWHGVGNDPTYNTTTCFETFPFPWSPGKESTEPKDGRIAAIAQWARELVEWRDAWLNPPPPPSNVVDPTFKKRLKQRTLTNLYNGLVYFRESKKPGQLWSQDEFEKVTRKSVTRSEIQDLDDIHQALDEAVLDAYGWPRDLSDEEILERLLELNLERAAEEENG